MDNKSERKTTPPPNDLTLPGFVDPERDRLPSRRSSRRFPEVLVTEKEKYSIQLESVQEEQGSLPKSQTNLEDKRNSNADEDADKNNTMGCCVIL